MNAVQMADYRQRRLGRQPGPEPVGALPVGGRRLDGVGSVLVFLPQILLLFLFIGILEDSGYLARAALIADRTMARVGFAGQIVHPPALRLCLRRSGRDGRAHHREQARPHRHHPDRSADDLRRPPARLHAHHLRFLPSGRFSARCWAPAPPPCWPVRARLRDRLRHRPRAQILDSEERAGAFRARDAPLPPADVLFARLCGSWTAPRSSCAGLAP